jgi:hypothetical protein
MGKFHYSLLPIAEVEQRYREWRDGDPLLLCLCGCGKTVTIFAKHSRRFAHNYKPGHHPNQDTTAANEARRVDTIPIEQFRAAILKIMKEKGISGVEMLQITGYSHGHWSSLMYAKSRKSVTKKSARHMFARLAGQATPPTRNEVLLWEAGPRNSADRVLRS